MAKSVSGELSTGNKLRDSLLGGMYGIAEASNPQGRYYVQSNWRGNGLASTGLGYLQDPNYRNMFDAAQMTSALFDKNKNKFGFNKNKETSIYNLGALFNNKDEYGSIADAIGKEARPTMYDIYSDNYSNIDNNYGTGISRGVTDYMNNEYDNNSILGYLTNSLYNTPNRLYEWE